MNKGVSCFAKFLSVYGMLRRHSERALVPHVYLDERLRPPLQLSFINRKNGKITFSSKYHCDLFKWKCPRNCKIQHKYFKMFIIVTYAYVFKIFYALDEVSL